MDANTETKPDELPVCPYCVLNSTRGESGCTCGYLRELELRVARVAA